MNNDPADNQNTVHQPPGEPIPIPPPAQPFDYEGVTEEIAKIKKGMEQIGGKVSQQKRKKLAMVLCGSVVLIFLAGVYLRRSPEPQNSSSIASLSSPEEETGAMPKINRLEKEQNETAVRMTSLENEKKELLHKISGLETETADRMASLENEKKELFHKIAGLETEKRASLNKIAGLETEKKSALQKIAGLETEKKACLQKITQFQAKIRQLENENDRLIRLENSSYTITLFTAEASGKFTELIKELESKGFRIKIIPMAGEKNECVYYLENGTDEIHLQQKANDIVAMVNSYLQEKISAPGKIKNKRLHQEKVIRVEIKGL